MVDIQNVINYIKVYAKQIDLDFNLIYRIQLVIHDKGCVYEGKINPITINDTLHFELFIQQNVLNNLLSENADKVIFSQNVIQHELYHCKEMSITSAYIDWHTLYFLSTMTTTKSLLLDTAVHQWSEYYAYYNSSKNYERDIKIIDYMSSANASLKVLYNKLIENPNMSEIQIINSFITNIISFIHISITLIAHYNSTHSKKYMKELDYIRRSTQYSEYYSYLKDLSYYMHSLYITYPKWVSEDAFVELAYKLFSFIHINNLTYSTKDLLDNFMFKLI